MSSETVKEGGGGQKGGGDDKFQRQSVVKSSNPAQLTPSTVTQQVLGSVFIKHWERVDLSSKGSPLSNLDRSMLTRQLFPQDLLHKSFGV